MNRILLALLPYLLAAAVGGVGVWRWDAMRDRAEEAERQLEITQSDLAAQKVVTAFHAAAARGLEARNRALAASNERLQAVRDFIEENDDETPVDPFLRGVLDRILCARDPNCDASGGGAGSD